MDPSIEQVVFDGWGVRIRGEMLSPPVSRGKVLLLHGGGQTHHAWGSGARMLAADGWTCIAVDLRGHGESDWAPDHEYDVASYARDIRAVISALGDKVALIGASLGGITALTLAAQPDVPVSALVLVDIVPRPEPRGVERIREFMTAHLDGFASLEDVAEAVAAYTGRPRRNYHEGLKKNVRLRSDGRWYWHWDPALMQPRSQEEPRPGITGEELMECARRVKVPVLVVHGATSDVVSDNGIEELLEAVDDIRVVSVAGAGHMVAGDDNGAFVGAVRQFLDDHL